MIISRNLYGVFSFIIYFRKLNVWSEKNRGPKSPIFWVFYFRSTDSRSGESNRSAFSSSKVEREVVSVTFVHHFHAKTSTVEDICPSVDHFALTINDGLVEVETVEVERHRRYAQGSKPDTDNRPSSKEEV